MYALDNMAKNLYGTMSFYEIPLEEYLKLKHQPVDKKYIATHIAGGMNIVRSNGMVTAGITEKYDYDEKIPKKRYFIWINVREVRQ